MRDARGYFHAGTSTAAEPARDLRWFDAIERAHEVNGRLDGDAEADAFKSRILADDDTLAETESAARPAAAPREIRAHPLPPYRADDDPASPWALGALAALVVGLVVAVVVAHRDLSAVSARITARDSAIAAEHRCAVPSRDGDRVVLTVVNRGGQLVATCLPVTDWREPERAAR